MLSPSKVLLGGFARTSLFSSPRAARRASQRVTAATAKGDGAVPSATATPTKQHQTPSKARVASPSTPNNTDRSDSVAATPSSPGTPSVARRLSLVAPVRNVAAAAAAAEVESSQAPQFTAASLHAAVDGTMRTFATNDPAYALEQLRRLVPHSERLAPWQQHAALLLCCAEVCLALGEAGDAATYAIEAVELHTAVSADGACVHARTVAAAALQRCGRRAEAVAQLAAACKTVETGAATMDQQTSGSGKRTQALDPAVPFVEYARLLEQAGSKGPCADLLKRAIALPRASADSLAAAHTLLARVAAAENQLEQADQHFSTAIAHTTNADRKADLLAEAAFFAQHRLRSVDRGVQYYSQLFQLRPPTLIGGSPTTSTSSAASPVSGCARVGECLLNAASCYEQHPKHGCAAAVPLYRAALSQFPPAAQNTLRLRLYLARAYSGSGQIDRAVEEYEAIINAMVHGGEHHIQLDVNGLRGYVPLCEVYGHLALCLFQRVGDPSGALNQYTNAFNAAKASQEAAEGHESALLPPPHATSMTPASPDAAATPPRAAKPSPPTQKRIVPPPRTLEWLHEGYGALLLRLGKVELAVTHLEDKIEYAANRNDPAVDAHLHVASAYESLGRAKDASHVYQHLFSLPLTASTVEQRLEIAQRYAWLCHYTLGDYVAAVTLYLAALHIDADNPHTMVQAAWCMLQQPDVDMAEVEALYVSAALAVEAGKHPSSSTSSCPPQFDECYVLGECAVFHHDFTRRVSHAQELYLAALQHESSGNFAQVAANYAVFLQYEMKDVDGAMEWFERALHANPTLPAAMTAFAEFLMATNQLDRAIDELGRLLPYNRAEAWHKLARIAERTMAGGTWDQAVAAYCRSLGAPDELVEATDGLIVDLFRVFDISQLHVASDLLLLLHYKAKRYGIVERLYKLAIDRFPAETYLHMHYGKFCVEALNKRKRAHRSFRCAIALDPTNVTVLDHYADFLAANYPDRLDAAEAVHLQSIRVNPNSAQAHFSYATFLTYVYKAPERAEEQFKQALELDPHDSVTLCCYAAFLENQAEARGRKWEYYELSLEYAERMHIEACKINPTNVSHGIFYGNYLWRQQRHPEAWGELLRALHLEPSSMPNLRLAATFLHDWYRVMASRDGHRPSVVRDEAQSTAAALLADAASDQDGSSPAADGVFALPGADSMDLAAMASSADMLFRKVIATLPRDTTTLRAYARFVDDVKRDTAFARQLEHAAVELELAEHDAAILAATAEEEGELQDAHKDRDTEDGDKDE